MGKLTDEQHAQVIRDRSNDLRAAINTAAADGLNIEIRTSRRPDTIGSYIEGRHVDTLQVLVSRPLSGRKNPDGSDPF